ncbi:circadian clock KaiB family protein [Acaryochloris sp. IP29b_bin.137]|uniref:circadian clock KaiB family protein n=1 Tax=Acaryochloris sp. IP29b_bin.137 TaxID=2969217 RepID=UPI00262C97DE|nr:circadian clock KaiB family protein [Acaryochloris sp. IP29b_bin.137]
MINPAVTTVRSQSLPFLYKGLALFTPGGDLVYCIDPDKRGHWHTQLCRALQTLLHLPELPLFLVPCYTATLDRWLHPHTQQLQISAELYPRVWRYRSLLNILFDLSDQPWHLITHPVEMCDPWVINSYRDQFPQLWQNNNLIVRLDQLPGHPEFDPAPSRTVATASSLGPAESAAMEAETQRPQGYVLRLFVSSQNTHTTGILENLHQLLEQVLDVPYTLKVIDVSKHPERAEADQIAATPTLVKAWPQPVRRLVGNQLETDTILQLLDITEIQSS